MISVAMLEDQIKTRDKDQRKEVAIDYKDMMKGNKRVISSKLWQKIN